MGNNNKVDYPQLLSPKAYDIVYQSETAGLLAFPDWQRPSHYGLYRNSGCKCCQHERITAAGTAPDFLPADRQVTGFPCISSENHFRL